MKKIILISVVLLIQGCSSQMGKRSVHYNKHSWPDGCPLPSSNQIDKSGNFNITKGEVLKCQVQAYTSMSNVTCQGITDSDTDALICNNWIFLFNKQGVMTNYYK